MYKLTKTGDGWVCSRCISMPSSDLFIRKMVRLGDIVVSQRRIDELDRARILPYNAPNGGHYVGRVGDNGKIQEREPNIT